MQSTRPDATRPSIEFYRVGRGNSVSRSSSEFVLVDEAAKEVASMHTGQWRRRVASSRSDGGRVGRLEVERAVRPRAVVVAHIDVENAAT